MNLQCQQVHHARALFWCSAWQQLVLFEGCCCAVHGSRVAAKAHLVWTIPVYKQV